MKERTFSSRDAGKAKRIAREWFPPKRIVPTKEGIFRHFGLSLDAHEEMQACYGQG